MRSMNNFNIWKKKQHTTYECQDKWSKQHRVNRTASTRVTHQFMCLTCVWLKYMTNEPDQTDELSWERSWETDRCWWDETDWTVWGNMEWQVFPQAELISNSKEREEKWWVIHRGKPRGTRVSLFPSVIIWHVAALTDSGPGDRAGWLVLCRSGSGHGSAVSALTEIPTPWSLAHILIACNSQTHSRSPQR